ncbi:MAG: glutamate--tRNA ligase [Betaproteobacteria bacterium]|nr:glutamate--tRNA ligase [Betaproteobacteria bacterium]
MTKPVRTRFAPSPTGFLHVGGARTALYSWAFARQCKGTFVLRVEDTDLERSTQASVDAILDGMKWLGLDWDEGPFFQMQRLERYKAVGDALIASGHAYPCWATKEELDAMREAQRAKGLKPRYDGRWRPERAKAAGLVPPADRAPVIRFRTPDDGDVGWDDLVKGPISFPNAELDDLVILRADGVPTYNFGVVVDDLDMDITHVIRGDDHVNNTPRQIHIFHAMGQPLPRFGHVPMILGPDGERLSKRHGAVSVTQYREDGVLPEALDNYLARLGWSHGDAEIFSMDQLVEWFNFEHVSRSAAQFDPEKLSWLNQHYIKASTSERLAALVAPELAKLGRSIENGPPLAPVVALLKDRATSILHLAEAATLFYGDGMPVPALLAEHLTETSAPALRMLQAKLAELSVWDKAGLSAAMKVVLTASGLKMPQLAMPVRVLVLGRVQTPAIDAVLELLGRETVLSRLARHLDRD